MKLKIPLTQTEFKSLFQTNNNEEDLKLKLACLGHRYLFEGVILQDKQMMQVCIDEANELQAKIIQNEINEIVVKINSPKSGVATFGHEIKNVVEDLLRKEGFEKSNVQVNFPDKEKPSFDFKIKVDRSQKIAYPDWIYGNHANEVLHPELEHTGSTKYDLREIGLSLESIESKKISAEQTVFVSLERTGALLKCLSLLDLLVIQTKGADVFRQVFRIEKKLYGWKSLVKVGYDSTYVPYLIVLHGGNKVVLDWDKVN